MPGVKAIIRIDHNDKADWVPLKKPEGYHLVSRSIPYPDRNWKVNTKKVTLGRRIAVIAIMLYFLPPSVKAQSALEVESWCQPIANAKHAEVNSIYYRHSYQTGFCWGAFGALQQLSRLIWSETHKPMPDICAPDGSTRDQYIKIFSKFVSDHPETAHQDFAHIARIALAQAFQCDAVTLPR